MIAQFKLDEDMIYLVETLKVEGYWSKKYFTLTLQNKDLPLLNHIEDIVNKKFDVKIGKRLLLKIRLEDNSNKEQIRLLWKDKEINFHIEKSPFNNERVKAVTSLPYKQRYNLFLIRGNDKIPIKIKYNKNNILCEGELKCWVYGDLRFPTKEILDFLEDYCGDKKNFHVEDLLFNADEKIVMSAFSALVDCEGTINWYGFKRMIQIRMRNKEYLEQWSKLLKRLKIGNKFRKNKDDWEVNISGWDDFNKLETMGFKLHHSKKSKKWKEMLNGFKRNQISRDGYKEFYIRKLKEINKKINADDFATNLNKSKRVVSHYLLKLEREGSVICDREQWPYLYFIST